MKIVLSNHSLFKLGGSETWVRTMYDELTRLGHTVHVYTPIHQLWKDIPDYSPREHYDLGILNHSNCLRHLSKVGNIDKIIFTSHGVIPQPEWPVPGADIYVAVSEEVQENVKGRWGIDSTVIRNPINTQRFIATKPTNPQLRNVLFLSNYGWTVEEVVSESIRGLNYRRIGGDERKEAIWEDMNWADLVVGLGRCIYEAMACGRNALVFDYQGGDGFVTPENIFTLRMKNCSGRTYRHKWTGRELRAEMDKYHETTGHYLRDYVVEHHDVRRIAQEYLAL